ncbi:MAG: ComF family protein [Bacteroidota bacterium]
MKLGMWKDFLSLFVSTSCYGCERELTTQENCICLNCYSQIERTYFEATPLENELYMRVAGRVPLEGATSLFYYDKKGRLQRLIQELKYKDAPQLGIAMGEYMAAQLKTSPILRGLEGIVPVPLHWRRKIQRGYNQAERIAKGMGDQLGIPVIEHKLVRVGGTATQTTKQKGERFSNVANRFKLKEDLPQRILLVDDIITTGSTIEACARSILAHQPSAEIRIASIGMARKHI